MSRGAASGRSLVPMALIGAWIAVTLIWIALFAISAALDHNVDRDFLAVYDCRSTGRSFSDCTRDGPGAALRDKGVPH